MKQHIIIKLKEPVSEKKYWKDSIEVKGDSAETLNERVDFLLKEHKVPVWVTAEYEPREEVFTSEEKEVGLDRTYRLILREERIIPNRLLQQLHDLVEVEYVRKSEVTRVDLPAPSKAMTSYNTEEAREQLLLKQVHQFFTRGKSTVKVAVLDTGVNLSHPELRHSLLPGYDFVNVLEGASDFFGDSTADDDDPEDELVGHGTHVAGIISGLGKSMPIGVAPNCKIIPVRVLGTIKNKDKHVGAGFVDHINTGIKWAVDQGADIINMSLGIQHEGGGLPHEDAVKYAHKRGVTIVAASGNDGQENLYYPGALPHVIAVGATKDKNNIAPFSTYGKVTVCAPGENIYSSSINNEYAFASGTSQAAPFVTGVIALLKSFAKENGRELSDQQIKYILKHTSDKPTERIKTKHWGFGQINPTDALNYLNYKLN